MDTAKHVSKIHQFDSKFKPVQFEEMANTLLRRHLSILIQLQTGHIELAKHLHRIKKAASPICQQCRAHKETVMHYLLFCTKYQ
jgi:hypothetical protein